MTTETLPNAAGRPEPEIALQFAAGEESAAAAELRLWLASLLRELAPGCGSFGVRFVGAREMRAVNRRFRGVDAPTDVLAFPGGRDLEGPHLGDVLVCLPVARRQAGEGGRPLASEIRTLILHGVLHCLGHDHETDDGAMERLERRLRRRWIPWTPAGERRG